MYIHMMLHYKKKRMLAYDDFHSGTQYSLLLRLLGPYQESSGANIPFCVHQMRNSTVFYYRFIIQYTFVIMIL